MNPSMLLVDDDEVFRTRLARALAARGYEVRTAANFDSALAAAREDAPEYAVVDLRMPGRSGMELLKELKALEPTLKVAMLTGYGSIATTVEAMRLGATTYLPKPVDADDVVEAFARAEVEVTVQSAAHRVPSLARTEWEHIQRVLTDCDGNISEAARRLGIHRRSLQRKLSKHPPAS